jgi:hypothetical protein
MTVGTGIFLASLVLGTIVLFGITKDRWSWPKLALTLFVLGALGAAGLYAWNATKESREAEKEAHDAALAKSAEQAEARTRLCVAGDLPRIENIARSIQGAVHDGMKLEDVKATADKLAGATGGIIPPKDDIKERVLIYELSSQCDSTFHLLVNVRADEQGALRWLRIWAKNPPVGYPEGLHEELSNDFEEERSLKVLQASKAETDALEARRLAQEKQHRADSDPCAPGLSEAERLSRLATFGKVREIGGGDYTAGGHSIQFLSDGSLFTCD